MPMREPMSSIDTAWLRMDRPHNLMVIMGVLLLDGCPDFTDLKKIFEERFLAYRRFRQRVVTTAGSPYWEDDPAFDLDRHVQRYRPGKSRPRSLQSLAARLAARPLDPAHPLWQVTFVPDPAHGAALIIRIHHAYADGMALVGVMLRLTDDTARRASRRLDRPVEPHATSWILEPLPEPLAVIATTLARTAPAGREGSLRALQYPADFIDGAKLGLSLLTEAGRIAFMAADSPTCLKGQPGGAKRVAWTEDIPLDAVKATGHALGCTVNDVLLAAVAGALGRYLRARGQAGETCEIRALVPVNLRPHDNGESAPDLGNRFGLVALLLPVGIVNPITRLRLIRGRMTDLKDSSQAAVTLGLLGLMGCSPRIVQDVILDSLAARATLVMTNLPGPPTQRFLAGAPISAMMFWVPQSGTIGLGLSILSYNGHVRFGLIADRALVPDTARIVAGIQQEFETLLLTALMEPWDGEREPGVIEAELTRAARRSGGPRQGSIQGQRQDPPQDRSRSRLGRSPRGRPPLASRGRLHAA